MQDIKNRSASFNICRRSSNKFIISNMHILHRLGIQPKRRQYLQHLKRRNDLLDLFWTRTHTCPNVVFPFKWEIASRASRARWCSISSKMIKIKKSVHTYLLSRDEVWKITGMVSISVYMDLYWVNTSGSELRSALSHAIREIGFVSAVRERVSHQGQLLWRILSFPRRSYNIWYIIWLCDPHLLLLTDDIA